MRMQQGARCHARTDSVKGFYWIGTRISFCAWPRPAPELFPRADGTTWVCAISTTGPVPVDPADVAPDKGGHARLEALCRNISPALAAAPIKARQACFRPVTEDGLPLIGAVPGIDGAYVATGHSVWGMLNAPATGEAMSELILDGAAHRVDLAAFAPGRLPTLDPARGVAGWANAPGTVARWITV
jgi:glycine/D-amino acid oxidase-like deaminating enzyme